MVTRVCRPVTLQEQTIKAKDDFRQVTGREIRTGIHLTTGQIMPQPLAKTANLGGGSDIQLAMAHMQGGFDDDVFKTYATLVTRPKRVDGTLITEYDPKSSAIPGLGPALEREESIYDIMLENMLIHDNLTTAGRATASEIADARRVHLKYAVGDAVDASGIPSPKDMNKAARANLFYLGMVKEGIMTSPFRVGSASALDAGGNSWFQIIGGYADVAPQTLNPRNLVALAKHTMRGDEVTHATQKLYNALDMDVNPMVMQNLASRDLFDIAAETKMYQAFSLGGRFKAGGTASRAFASKWGRALRYAVDQNARMGVLGSAFSKQYRVGRIEFFEHLRATYGDDVAQGVIDDLIPTKHFSPTKLRQTLIDNGIDEYDELAAGWRKKLSDIDKFAVSEVTRIHFKGQMTRADEHLRHVMLFHFWQSRAIVYYPRTVLSNPYLLHNHIQLYEALDREAERQNAGNPMNLYFKFMKSNTGWFFQIDAMSYVLPFTMIKEWSKSYGDESNFDKFSRLFGAYVHPGIGAALSIIGASDTFPTLMPNATRGVAVAVHNFLRNHGVEILGGPGISGDPVSRLEKWGMNGLNDLLADQGVAKDVEPFDATQQDRIIVNDLIIANAEEDFGMTYAEMLANEDKRYINEVNQAQISLMMGSPNDRAEEALAEWSTWDQAVNAGVRAVVPGYIPVRSGVSTTRKDVNSSIYDNAPGAPLTPAQENAQAITESVNAGSPESLTLNTANTELRGIGTERQNDLYKGWNIIVYDNIDDGQEAVIGGKLYSGYQINMMTHEQRVKLADAWVLDNMGTKELESYREDRDEIIAASPDLTEYKAYSKAASKYEGGAKYTYDPKTQEGTWVSGGVRAMRLDFERLSPQFGQQVDAERKRLEAQGRTGEELENSLDIWASGTEGYNAWRGIKDDIRDRDVLDVKDESKIPIDIGVDDGSASSDTTTSGATKEATSGYGGEWDADNNRPMYQTRLVDEWKVYEAAIATFEKEHGPIEHYSYADEFVERSLPDPTSTLSRYLKWRFEQMEAGKPGDIDSYLKKLDADYKAKHPEKDAA